MSSKKTTKTDQKTATTSNATIPQFMTDASKQVVAETVAAPKQTAYTGTIAAPQTAAQQQATTQAQATAGSSADAMKNARDLTNQAAGATQQQVQASAAKAAQAQAATREAALAGAAPTMRAAQQEQAAPTVTADQIASRGDFNTAAADKYMDPYKTQVQGATINEMRRQNGIDRAGLKDQAQAMKAYGGARDALLEGEQMRGQNDNMTRYLADSNSAAYSDAANRFNTDRSYDLDVQGRNQGANLTARTTNAGLMDTMLGRNMSAENAARAANMGAASDFALSDQAAKNAASESNADRLTSTSTYNAGQSNQIADANAARAQAASTANAANQQSMLDRMLAAGGQQADIGTAATNANATEIGNLMKTGTAAQLTDQAAKDAAYQEFLRLQGAPLDDATKKAQVLGALPTDKTITGTGTMTGTTKQKGSMLDTMLGVGQIAASAFSDRRLKRDIAIIGRMANGLGVYLYRYLWDAAGTQRTGVMADEVARLAPAALGPRIAGFATVDYSKLGRA